MSLLKKIISVLLFSIVLISCSGKPPSNIGLSGQKLAACPSSPNCVSSDSDAVHKVLPLQLKMPANEAWNEVAELISSQLDVRIISKTENYLHAEYKSTFFGFIDDLELHLRPDEQIIAIRSASRLGYSDFGVNRKRVNVLSVFLQSRGIIK